MKYYFNILLLINIVFVGCKEDIEMKNVDIVYHLEKDKNHCGNQLIAWVDDKKQILIDFKENRNVFIYLQEDFNNDGALDILLEHRQGCDNLEKEPFKYGGSSYFLMTYDGRKFRKTEEVGKDWNDGIEIKKQNEKLYFTFETSQQNTKESNIGKCVDKKEVFIVDGYNLKRVSTKENTHRKTIKEIHLESYNNYERASLNYDLNNDGIEDYITSYYYNEKHRYMGKKPSHYAGLSIILSNKESLVEVMDERFNRLGVLESKTNGVHDLLINCNTILKWNGHNYKEEGSTNKVLTYKVFAEKGLIVRDSPNGEAIEKLDYGTKVKLIKKTNYNYSWEENEENEHKFREDLKDYQMPYKKIYGFWYNVEFVKKQKKKQGYVFSGFLINLEKQSIFSQFNQNKKEKFDRNFIDISKNQIYFLGFDITFPIKILKENEIELIFTNDKNNYYSFDRDYGAGEKPKEGEPFAKFTLEEDIIKATYYYPKWAKKRSHTLLNSYKLSHGLLIDKKY